MKRILVPAKEGRAFKILKNDQFKLITPLGAQAVDFFAFSNENIKEWLSANITWTYTRNTKPREGDVFLSRFRRPMLSFLEDGANFGMI